MSYCRWSSDNFDCDLYCFEHVDGYWQTYVANNRHRLWLRVFNWITDKRLKYEDGTPAFRVERFQTFRWPHWLTHKRIGLPCDGASFEDDTEHAMYERITYLHRMGYHVPKDLLEEISREFTTSNEQNV